MIPAQKQNVTVSLDSHTLRKVKVLAAKRSTSISGFIAEQIEALVGADDAYEVAQRAALDRLDTGFPMGGGLSVGRDELHQR